MTPIRPDRLPAGSPGLSRGLSRGWVWLQPIVASTAWLLIAPWRHFSQTDFLRTFPDSPAVYLGMAPASKLSCQTPPADCPADCLADSAAVFVAWVRVPVLFEKLAYV